MTIIEAARKYLGTSYRRQGRDAYGLDCGGFCVLVFRDAGYAIEDVTGYANAPDGATFERILQNHCIEISNAEIEIGDILAMDYKDGIQHIGIVSQTENYIKIIHCKNGRGVVEHRLMSGTEDFRAWSKSYRIK